MSYTIKQIAEQVHAQVQGNENLTINRILTDSRSLCFPEDTLFFALKSKRGDGHRYIHELYARGVRAFVVSHLPKEAGEMKEAAFLLTENPQKALQKLAEVHRTKFNIPIIGITGSNGKTVVKEWLYQLLGDTRRITRSPRSYNSQTGVPLSVWMLNEQTELGIFEAGISEMGEMDALQSIIRPTIGILTNIGGAHQENFYSLQEKCMEKLALFKDCDVIIYNGDNQLLGECVTKSMLTAKEIAWSTEDDEKPLYIRSISKDEASTHVCYRYIGFDGDYRIPYIDEASIENSLNCLAACLYLMMSPEEIARRMPLLEPVAMRLEVKEGKHGCTVINDTYNSDLASLDIALDFMARRPDRQGRRRTLILSDILQTGQTAKFLYRRVAQLVESRGIEKIIGVGEEISASAEFFSMEKHFFPSTESLLASEVFTSLRNEVILVKGARRFHFDTVTEQLELNTDAPSSTTHTTATWLRWTLHSISWPAAPTVKDAAVHSSSRTSCRRARRPSSSTAAWPNWWRAGALKKLSVWARRFRHRPSFSAWKNTFSPPPNRSWLPRYSPHYATRSSW